MQIDIAQDMLSPRYPVEAHLVGDRVQPLRASPPVLDRKTERSWRGHVEDNVAEVWRVRDARAHAPARPSNPHGVAGKLSSRLPERAIITSDPGACASWHSRDLNIRRVLETRSDPEAPPLPPHIPPTQAKHLASPCCMAIRRSGSVIAGATKELLRSILRGHEP